MLYILGEINSPEVLPSVRPYCRHENLKVSFEAIKCLLGAGDRYGIQAVRDYLHSESREQVEQAIALAGTFRMKEFVPDLIQMLRKRGIGGADLYNKIPVVRTLGDIGDPAALPVLREALSEKSLLFRGASERLKEEIYSSLKNYQYDDIRDMIDAGLKSKNQIYQGRIAAPEQGRAGLNGYRKEISDKLHVCRVQLLVILEGACLR